MRVLACIDDVCNKYMHFHLTLSHLSTPLFAVARFVHPHLRRQSLNLGCFLSKVSIHPIPIQCDP